MSHLADNVRRFRKAKGLTQLELMDESGVTSVKRIEAGQILSPEYKNLESLAKALGVSVADLYAAPPKAVAPRKRNAS
jgi:transcriptional regulator with XRE-family HTH domain